MSHNDRKYLQNYITNGGVQGEIINVLEFDIDGDEDMNDPKYKFNFEIKNNYKIDKFMRLVIAERDNR